MTREQIEKLRDDIKDRQSSYFDNEIDELCDLALKALRPEKLVVEWQTCVACGAAILNKHPEA